MPSISTRSRRSRAQWQALIARAEQSELSITEFCQRESVSTASFYTWRNRLSPGVEPVSAPVSTGTDFIDLGAFGEGNDSAAAWVIELDLGAGMVLRLRRG
jgi:hypothetical protein